MKYAITRTRLAAQRDVLCFEREAAGLMSCISCKVIRCICDYADTHRNDVWQGYAAMTAAAYVKDLLLRMSAESVQAVNPVSSRVEVCIPLLVLKCASFSLIHLVSSSSSTPGR